MAGVSPIILLHFIYSTRSYNNIEWPLLMNCYGQAVDLSSADLARLALCRTVHLPGVVARPDRQMASACTRQVLCCNKHARACRDAQEMRQFTANDRAYPIPFPSLSLLFLVCVTSSPTSFASVAFSPHPSRICVPVYSIYYYLLYLVFRSHLLSGATAYL